MLPLSYWGRSPVKDMFEGRLKPEVEQAFRPARDALLAPSAKGRFTTQGEDDGGSPKES